MSRTKVYAVAMAVALSAPGAGRADDAEDKAAAHFKNLGALVFHDDKIPGKPVILVGLLGKGTDADLSSTGADSVCRPW